MYGDTPPAYEESDQSALSEPTKKHSPGCCISPLQPEDGPGKRKEKISKILKIKNIYPMDETTSVPYRGFGLF